jgi:hypothetical protein
VEPSSTDDSRRQGALPGSDIAVDHVPFLGEALVERRARPC